MNELTAAQRRQLDENGFVTLPGLLEEPLLTELRETLERLWQAEGEEASVENYVEPQARRLANLADKGAIFGHFYTHPLVLAAARHVVGPDVRVSMLNARDALPQTGGRQALHADTDGGAKPDEQGYFACTAIWMLDAFTVENGATRLVPGTHLSGQVPKEALDDIFQTHPDEVRATGEAGDVVVFNGHCWHAGGLNATDGTRRALLVHYLRAGVPRNEKRRQILSPENRAQRSALELELLGLDDV